MLASVKLRIGVTDDKQDALLVDLIEDAQQRVLAYINQDGNAQTESPPAVGWVIKDIVVKMYNRIGDEGKESGSEGNVSSTWESIDLSSYANALDPYRKSSSRRRPGTVFI